MDTMNLSLGNVTNNPPQVMSNSDNHASNPKQGASFSGPISATRAQSGGSSNQGPPNRNRTRGGNRRGRRPAQSNPNNNSNSVTSVPSTNLTNASGGRARGPRRSAQSGGGVGGKYKQRHNTDMYLDESSLAGLDIDLAESILPTTSAVGSSASQTQAHKGRNSAASSRKLNLTHLLNYKFEGRHRSFGNQQTNQNSSFSRSSGGHHRLAYCNRDRPMRFSKQQFLQANCQFVVLSGHDYSIHKADPDLPVDWDKVEEIRFLQTTTTETTCPICLNPPIAAKITRCGHIYCWPCMLHYLSLSDENCRQCPICFEIVYRTDLRSVVSHTYKNYSLEDEITLKLMIRSKGSIEVHPYPSNSQKTRLDDEEEEVANDNQITCTPRRNLLIVDGQTVLDTIIARERQQLELQKEADSDEPEVCFVMEALSLVARRTESMERTVESMLLAELAALGCDNQDIEVSSASENNHPAEKASPTMMLGADSESNIDQRGFKNYLFYQSIDGQHIYLNAFNTKVLCHEYEAIEHCPPVIKAKIIQMDWISMNEAWRRRYRFLEHLPLTCEFRLVEIELANYQYVSEKTYKHFEGEIMKRELERQRRLKEERKREKIIRVEQNRKIYGIQPSLKISLDNPDQFPSVMDERFFGLGQPPPTRHDDTVSSDDDYDEDEHPLGQPCSGVVDGIEEQTNNDEDHQQVDEPLPPVEKVPLSFREIQLQEAAAMELAIKNAKKKKKEPTKSAWGQQSIAQLLVDGKQGTRGNKATVASEKSPIPPCQVEANREDPNGGGQSSSFAKLLVDAKSGQWTSKATANSSHSHQQQQQQQQGGSRSKTRTLSGHTDYSDEEPPPSRPMHEFTLADFLQFNVITNSKKRGNKSNNNKNKSGSPAK